MHIVTIMLRKIFSKSEKPRDQKPNYFDLAQAREDEEQAAYLAEWSRRHGKCK